MGLVCTISLETTLYSRNWTKDMAEILWRIIVSIKPMLTDESDLPEVFVVYNKPF